MTKELKIWAVTERAFLQEELKWLKDGAKLISPSGDDITSKKITELELRLDHANKVIAEQDDAEPKARSIPST